MTNRRNRLPWTTVGFRAFWSLEVLKLGRSVVARLGTAVLIGLVPLGAIEAVALARSPGLPGVAAIKFAPYATGDLAATHLLVAGEILSVAVLTVGGFACAWSYGREFADGTAGALVGLPARLWTAAAAKALLLASWLSSCVLAALAVTLLLSLAVGGQPGAEAWHNTAVGALAGLLAVALVMPFAWVASVTRSPLGTVGVLIGVVAVTQIVVVLGAGAWFPYAVPSLLSGMGGSQAAAEIGPGSLIATAALAPLAVFAVAHRWHRLDDI